MTALTIERLTRDFGGLRALDSVSLTVGIGERRVILGPNGAGKTTLFNLITGLLEPAAGRILLFEHDVTPLAPFRRARWRAFASCPGSTWRRSRRDGSRGRGA